MKVKLVVVQGKPEGTEIPLVGPKFKIGRGETCHLRPASEQVSREHAEFTITAESVSVCDLGSRNGTLVNGKAIAEPSVLKDRDLVQVGPLTFAVSIVGGPAPVKAAVPSPPPKSAPEDVGQDDIEAWLVGDAKNPAPERPSGVYPGDTITITAFRDATAAKPPDSPAAASPPHTIEDGSDEEYERQAESESDTEEIETSGSDTDDDEAKAEGDEAPEEFMDESNPFYVKKKKEAESGPSSKPVYKDTSDAASDILRKMMERRRSQR
jgi:pSer/pThr/pTyr-binding forkhead associated (FHA) protein